MVKKESDGEEAAASQQVVLGQESHISEQECLCPPAPGQSCSQPPYFSSNYFHTCKLVKKTEVGQAFHSHRTHVRVGQSFVWACILSQ